MCEAKKIGLSRGFASFSFCPVRIPLPPPPSVRFFLPAASDGNGVIGVVLSYFAYVFYEQKRSVATSKKVQ